MIERIQENLLKILRDLYRDSGLEVEKLSINLQENNDKKHGDLASNIALILAKALKRNPKEIANSIKDAFVTDEETIRVEVAGPGFINFFLSTKSHGGVLKKFLINKKGLEN